MKFGVQVYHKRTCSICMNHFIRVLTIADTMTVPTFVVTNYELDDRVSIFGKMRDFYFLEDLF